MRLGYVYIPQEAVMNIGRDVAGDMRLVLRDDTMQLKTASLHVVKAKPDIRRSFRAVDEAGDAPMQMGWGQRNRITEAMVQSVRTYDASRRDEAVYQTIADMSLPFAFFSCKISGLCRVRGSSW